MPFAVHEYMSAWVARCPKCGYRLRWIEKVRTSKGFGFVRKTTNCPECSARIIWAKWPWRVMFVGVGGITVSGLLGILAILNDWSETWNLILMGVCVLLAMLNLIGCLAARLELATSANQAD